MSQLAQLSTREVRVDQLKLDQRVVRIDGQDLQPHYGVWPWVTSLNPHKVAGKVLVALSWSPWAASLDPDAPVVVLLDQRR